MLEFAAQPAQIKDAVGPFHPLEIDGHGVAATAEQKVGWGGVAVNQHGAVLPHATLGPPLVAPKVEFPGSRGAHAPLGYQGMNELAGIVVDFVVVDFPIPGGAVVQGGQEMGQGSQLAVETSAMALESSGGAGLALGVLLKL